MSVKELKPLVICLSYSWGGLEQVAAHDAAELAGLDIEVKVLCLKNSPFAQDLLKRKTKFSHLKTLEILEIDHPPRNYFDFKFGKFLRSIISTHGIRVIHVHQPSLLGSVVPALWGVPNVALIATRHIRNDHNKKSLFHKIIYNRLNAFIVMSQSLRENVIATHHIKPEKIKIIHYGLDFEIFDPAKIDSTKQRSIWGADENTLLVGLVGRIDPAKGQTTFIQAAAGLLKDLKHKEKIKFIIIGEETLGTSGKKSFLDDLKKMITQFRIENYIIFAGFQKNIPEVMKALDIFVMPSRQEAFGIVAIEAMSMECPIVISKGGSAEEIVGNEQYGLTIKPDDAFDLQRQIRYLIDHPSLRLHMGKQAREYVHTHFDQKKRLKKTIEIYENALIRLK